MILNNPFQKPEPKFSEEKGYFVCVLCGAENGSCAECKDDEQRKKDNSNDYQKSQTW